jgi:DNA-binding MarR family transcriptional regulator/GNAT superfamily N-acetyltransferase
MTSSAKSTVADQIATVRRFNRFYTAKFGLLRRRHLDGQFSLTESRALYEIGVTPGVTATALRACLELDAGYMSRLLTALARKRFIRQAPSGADRREKHLKLTATGERAVARLNELSDKQLRKMLANIPPASRAELAASLQTVRQILGGSEKPAIRVERLAVVNRVALALLDEYYEAVHVVLRDSPAKMRKMLREDGAGMWLAYRGDEAVGCVVLRGLASIPFAGECKRLYVKPAARGNHIADRLLDAQEEFARTQGMRWIYLDTYDDLKTAISLYERRGYRRCARYNDNPQATLFMRKRIA